MKVTVHEAGRTERGVRHGDRIVGGVFMPDGEYTRSTRTRKLATARQLGYDTTTGKRDEETLLTEQGTDWSVRVINRERKPGEEPRLVLWVSATDVDGVVHSHEFVAEPGDYEYGMVKVTIED